MPLRYFILMLSMLIVTIGQLSNYLYTPSMPAMVRELHTHSTQIQLSLSLPLITYGLAQLLYGALSDYYGRRKLVLVGLTIFMLGSIVTVLAPTIDVLLCGRMIQGLGVGAVGLTRVINRDVFSGAEFLKMGSYITMVLALVPILAPLLGGYIQDYIGWRGNFEFLLIYAVIILILVSLKLPETNANRHPGHPTLKSLMQGYAWVLSNKRFVAFLCCSLLTFSGEAIYIIIAPFLLQNELSWSAVAYGWLSLFSVCGFLIGAIIASRLSHNILPEKMLKIGSSITLFASLLMLALSWQLNTWVILLPMSIYMMGMSMITIPCGVAAMTLFTNRIGVAGAVYGSGIMVGSGLISCLSTQFHLHNQRPLALILSGIALTVTFIYSKFIRIK
ncbi:MAG: multidrug effflux MFS transporter [Gammaproteobacteria bacterium]|nr:multidrug effflux MFS transporter [Gammaproteobacteria bacterium]